MEELNLAPQMADETKFEGEGGGYYVWSNSKSPLLSKAKVGASKLLLHPGGLALPHYADSAKIGYVLQGNCTVGMVPPNTAEEKVLLVKKGDAIPVPLGVVSWWFNGGATDVIIVFLGETSKAHIPGQFTYFFLAGTLGILRGLHIDFISKAFHLNEKESEKLANNQTGGLIIKLGKGISIPEPSKDIDNIQEKMYASIDNALPDVVVKGGGSLSSFTETNFSLLAEVGLGACLVKLEANAMFAPTYTTDGSVRVIYVTRGSGRVRIVGAEGKPVLDTTVHAGEMFIVPTFFVAAKIADEDGMEFFGVTTSSKIAFGQLAGNTSVWKAFSPVALQSIFSIPAELAELFKSKNEKNTIIIPPITQE